MIGKWKGTYEYNPRKGFENSNLNPVEFDLEITAFESGSFSGNVQDNVEMGGTLGIGSISGEQQDDHIVFEKNMPFQTMHLQNGERTTNENKKHPTIVYAGKLNEDNNTITGTWKFKTPKFMWVSLLPWWYDLGNGTFRMHKISEDF